MKNPFSNSQSAYNYGAAQAGQSSLLSNQQGYQAGQSSLLSSQQGYHMCQAAQQAANQIGSMAGSFQVSQDLWDNIRIKELEAYINVSITDKEKAQIMVEVLHTDKLRQELIRNIMASNDDDLFRFKMFFG